jgi:hypothetical protein
MHINWWHQFGTGRRDYFKGAILIDKANQDMYWELLNRFPRRLPTIEGA